MTLATLSDWSAALTQRQTLGAGIHWTSIRKSLLTTLACSQPWPLNYDSGSWVTLQLIVRSPHMIEVISSWNSENTNWSRGRKCTSRRTGRSARTSTSSSFRKPACRARRWGSSSSTALTGVQRRPRPRHFSRKPRPDIPLLLWQSRGRWTPTRPRPKSPDVFFATKLCYWAPYELWKVRLSWSEPACRGHQLTSSSKTYKHTVTKC